jgi:hypothetical protein
MAAIAFDTVLVLGEMLAQSRLIQVVQLLATLILLRLHDGYWNELRNRLLLGLGGCTLSYSSPYGKGFSRGIGLLL